MPRIIARVNPGLCRINGKQMGDATTEYRKEISAVVRVIVGCLDRTAPYAILK
jgi:hypothetical protein